MAFKNVSKKYYGVNVDTEVFENVSFEIDKGEFVSIIGRSGSGKSTLLHLMGLIDRPTKGQIFLNVREVMGMSDIEFPKIRNSEFEFVFQDYKIIQDMTVFENFEVHLAFF